MSQNLFISYDLMSPGQDYNSVQEAIKRLGPWVKFQYSMFYVNTKLSVDEAYNFVRLHLDPNDKLAVIQAHGGMVDHCDQPVIDAVNEIWFTP
ncbi:hypothetical protein ACO0LM_00730 [Undibacterium sp. Di26W]|uniref:hypothetical protein n=1 Tax=Undibacterium sp. Di26W TaxID=3413035 RepID=UPI003BF389CB